MSKVSTENLLDDENVKKLIQLSVKKKKVSISTINRFLPEEVNTEANIDKILSILHSKKVEVTDEDTSNIEDASFLEEAKKKKKKTALADVDKVDDPIKIYLKDIGKIKLLSKDEEYNLAKSIEDGGKEVKEILYKVDYLFDLIEKQIKKADKSNSIEDIFNVLTSPRTYNVSQVQRQRLEKKYGAFRKKYLFLMEKRGKISNRRSKEYKAVTAQVVELVKKSDVSSSVYDNVTSLLKESSAQIKQAQKKIKKFLETYKLDPKKLEKMTEKTIPIFMPTTTNASLFMADALGYLEGKDTIKEIESTLKSNCKSILEWNCSVTEIRRRVEECKEKLIQANLRLVISIAKRYTYRGLHFFDLIQEGNIGLINAVKKYDYKKGYKFSTYSTWWIRQAIMRSISDKSRNIRIPVHMIEQVNKVDRETKLFVQKYGKEPTVEELAKSLGWKKKKVNIVKSASKDPISLETPIGDRNDSSLGDFIENKEADNPRNNTNLKLLKVEIERVLSRLPEREKDVIRMRYGLNDGCPHTLEETGYAFNVTRERIRQIEGKALFKLKHPENTKVLKDYLAN